MPSPDTPRVIARLQRTTLVAIGICLGTVFLACDVPPTGPSGDRGGTIAAGSFHSCWITASGAAFCWGDNSFGQLGDGSFAVQREPARVAGRERFRALSGGGGHTCGITRDRILLCWGANITGAIGDSTTAIRVLPTPTSGSLQFEMVTAGATHSCGLTAAGRVHCWGSHGSGQLGVRALTTSCAGALCSVVPIPVDGTLTFSSVSAGFNHTCGVTTNGAIYCWGANQTGQLGNGFTTSSPQPVLVAGELEFEHVAAGANYTCGITTDGALYCWGVNVRGQLGSSTSSQCAQIPCSTTPQAVSGSRRFQFIAAGASHTCGIATGGTAYCWGANETGQLGDGSVTDRNAPQPVLGGLTLESISAGALHTCAVSTLGDAYCWGDNFRRQIGNGGRGLRRSTPTLVTPPGGG